MYLTKEDLLDVEDLVGGVALADEFLLGGVKLLLEPLAHWETLDDVDMAVDVNLAWEGEDNSWLDAIWSVGRNWDSHGDIVISWSAADPVTDAGEGSVSGASSAGGAPGLDDGTTPGGDLLDELALELGNRDEVGDLLLAIGGVDDSVGDIRNLGVGVVAPDADLPDLVAGDAGLGSDLTDGTVVVEPGHGAEVLWAEVLSVVLADEAVGVSRVADDEDLDGLLGVVGESLTLDLEDATVLLEEVSPVHAILTWEGTNKEDDVGILEGNLDLVSRDDASEGWEGAVGELHADAVEGAKGRGDFEEVQLDLLLRAKEITLSDAEGKSIADLTSSTSDNHVDGFAHFKVK